MKRALVTGCGGFVGPYVAGVLAGSGFKVWGTDVRDAVSIPSLERYVSCDLTERAAFDALLRDGAPDALLHLAAQSSAGTSFDEPFETLTRNVLPILNALEFARTRRGDLRILAVGSGDVYGDVGEDELPLVETRQPDPVNPYALSKLIQEKLCLQYARLYDLDVVVTRSFNHTGSGQRDTFALSSFARQVTEIRLGLKKPVVEVGDIDLKRDFSDVRDVALAYAALLETGKKGEVYNVCSGVSRSLRDLLERLLKIAGVEAEIRVVPERMRRSEIRELRGDRWKIELETGWRPRFSIDETLESLIEFWTRTLGGAARKSG